MNEKIAEQLKIMGMAWDGLREIRSKDGIFVYRVICGDKTYVLKYFDNVEHRREIGNYKILMDLDIPTAKLVSHTDHALLMEDIDQSVTMRLGVKEDLHDTEVAGKIAKWYRMLHEKGKTFVAAHGNGLYDEADMITLENIELIKYKTNTDTADSPAWNILNEKFSVLKNRLNQTEKTLCYNDFYYTNMIVAKDKSAALMFDYNLLGKGYVYSDIRNVCSSLGDDARAEFLAAYGGYDKEEIILDDVVGTLVSLYVACTREKFPSWAEESVEDVKSGKFARALKRL